MTPPLLPCGQVQAGIQLLVGSLVSSALVACVKAMTRGHIPNSCWCGAGALTLRTGKEGVRSSQTATHCPAPHLSEKWGCREPSRDPTSSL